MRVIFMGTPGFSVPALEAAAAAIYGEADIIGKIPVRVAVGGQI